MNVILLDVNGIVCRYFFALNEMFDESGRMIHGVWGFSTFIKKIINKYKKTDFVVIAAFDKCSNNFRKKILPSYKANRKVPDLNLILQLELVYQLCMDLGFYTDFHNELEADDIIASYVKKLPQELKLIFSPDKDFIQLLSSNTKIINPFSLEELTEEQVQQKYSISSDKFALFLALCGDSSDNIPGIKGVGPKLAAKIINEYIDNIHQVLEKYPKYDFSNLEIMIQLTDLSCPMIDYPIPQLTNINFDNLQQKFNLIMNSWNFNIKI